MLADPLVSEDIHQLATADLVQYVSEIVGEEEIGQGGLSIGFRLTVELAEKDEDKPGEPEGDGGQIARGDVVGWRRRRGRGGRYGLENGLRQRIGHLEGVIGVYIS